MNKFYKLMAFLLVVTFLSSCVSTNRGYHSQPVEEGNVQADPILASIDVDDSEKIKGSSESTYFLFWRIKGDKEYADNIRFSVGVGVGSGSLTIAKILGALNPLNWIVGGARNKTTSAAAYNALQGKDADVLVHPTYSITEKNYLYIIRKFESSAEGYAGKYTDFRKGKWVGKTYVTPGGTIVTEGEIIK